MLASLEAEHGLALFKTAIIDSQHVASDAIFELTSSAEQVWLPS